MPFCTCRDCPKHNVLLPESEFEGDGKQYKQCSECRKRQLNFKQNGKRGLNSRGFKLHTTEPGPAPTFLMPGHKRMWQEWLRELIAQVER